MRRLILLTLLTIVVGCRLASHLHAQENPLKVYFTWKDTVPPYHITTINTSGNEFHYEFDIPGIGKLTESSPDFIITEMGSFSIKVKAFDKKSRLVSSNTYQLELQPDTSFDSLYVWIPNSGGGCSYNDQLYVKIQGQYSDYEFYLFDRWGEVIFSSNDATMGWDYRMEGYQAPQDVYVYRLRFSDTNGKMHQYVGNFTLIR